MEVVDIVRDENTWALFTRTVRIVMEGNKMNRLESMWEVRK